MPRRHWIIAVASGLIAFALSASSQEAQQPTLEEQPVSELRDEEGAGEGENTPEDGAAQPIDHTPALEQIEAAIRDLKTEVDEAERQRQKDNDRRDLEAQEAMARWAKAMFWAALGTLVVTGIGIFLIWKTLKHTRRAADYAHDMVREAKATTTASKAAAADAKRQADLAEDSYFVLEQASLYPEVLRETIIAQGQERAAKVTFRFVNLGRSPAVVTGVRHGFSKTGEPNKFEEVYDVIAPGSVSREKFFAWWAGEKGGHKTPGNVFRARVSYIANGGGQGESEWTFVLREGQKFVLLRQH